MTARMINGREVAEEIKAELKRDVDVLVERGTKPGLAVVLVGDNPASEIYVRMKTRTCAELGIATETVRLAGNISESELHAKILALNADDSVHGILVQLPLPAHIDEQRIINALDPAKDVDGFHPVNRGKLILGQATFIPCTPLGIQELLLRCGYSPERKHVVIVGRSAIVGLPLASMLVQKKPGANATVTVCHTGTADLIRHTREADILVAAVGRAEAITGDMVKDGVVVVDVGINRVEDASCEKGYRIVGDVHFASVAAKAAGITPVPGGVGPMTIAMLMKNTVEAASQSTRQ